MENEFLQIIKSAIYEAERIDCTFAEFVEGVRTMREELDERVSLAEDELKATLGDDDDA